MTMLLAVDKPNRALYRAVLRRFWNGTRDPETQKELQMPWWSAKRGK
jgi:hypothetical protein